VENKKGILFDFDGTLADTMENNFLAWQYAFQTKDVNIIKDDYFPLEGLPLKEVVSHIAKKYGIFISDSNEMIKIKEDYFKKIGNVSLYQGVDEFVDFLNIN